MAIRHPQLLNDAAVGEDLDHHPLAVVEGVAVDGDVARSRSERLLRDAGVAFPVVAVVAVALPARRDRAGQADRGKREGHQQASERNAAKQSGYFGSSFSPPTQLPQKAVREDAGCWIPLEPRVWPTRPCRFQSSPAEWRAAASSHRPRRARRSRAGGGTRRTARRRPRGGRVRPVAGLAQAGHCRAASTIES